MTVAIINHQLQCV